VQAELPKAVTLHRHGSSKVAYELYEGRMHRHFGLLVSANGGGFTVGTIVDKAESLHFEIGLSACQLAAAMAIITVATFADIKVFGLRARKAYDDRGIVRSIFGRVGGLLLAIICCTIIVAWMLVRRRHR
jgi:hypothetical protein